MSVCACVCQCVNDQLSLRSSSGVSSLCSLLAVVGQSQSDLLAIVPAKFVISLSFVVICSPTFCYVDVDANIICIAHNGRSLCRQLL